jgi:hypothetical protein
VAEEVKTEVKPDAKTEVKPEVKPEPKVEAKTETKETKADAKTETKTETKADTKPHALKDDDEIPENVDLVELSPRALKSRLTRHTKKELKSRFGTDDFDEIEKKLKDYETLQGKQEEERKAKLSETEKLKEDNAKLTKDLETARGEARSVKEQREFEKFDTQISSVAEKYLDPDYIEDELPKLARHLNATLSKREKKTLKGDKLTKVVESYFKERIKAKPKLAKDATVEVKQTTKLTSGADTNGKPTNADGKTEKTFAPNKANSMNKGEAREAMRKEGYHY